MRIAVVDDDSVFVELVTRLFPGHDIAAFSGARPVLEIIEAGERFDVIISDLMMPGITGTDMHTELMRTAPEQASRMILITGGLPPEGTPVPTLRKPFHPTTLRELVERVGGG